MTAPAGSSSPRLPPPQLDEEASAGLRPYRLPGGEIIPLFATLAHSPAALDDLKSATRYCIGRSSLDVRLRELAILRVCVLCGAEAEWSTHVAMFADAAGLGGAELADVFRAPAQGSWTPLERLVLETADSLTREHSIDDALWRSLQERLAPPEIVDLLMVTGQYLRVAVTTNALRLSPLPGTPRFSDIPGAADGYRGELT